MYREIIFKDKNQDHTSQKGKILPNVRLPWKLQEKIRLPDNPIGSFLSKNQKAAIKEEQKHRDVTQQRFNKLVTSSHKVLYELASVFPFDFFPDHISIEPNQINFANHYFFFTAELRSIPIRNVADVFLDTSFFFASLKIIDASFIENSVQVDYLKKSEACKARCIIQGLVLARKEGIDITQLPTYELAKKTEELGMARHVDLIKHPN